MLAASDMLLQEQKWFHLFLLKHLSVDWKIELFLFQWIWFWFILVKTRLLFDVFFRGYMAEVED